MNITHKHFAYGLLDLWSFHHTNDANQYFSPHGNIKIDYVIRNFLIWNKQNENWHLIIISLTYIPNVTIVIYFIALSQTQFLLHPLKTVNELRRCCWKFDSLGIREEDLLDNWNKRLTQVWKQKRK